MESSNFWHPPAWKWIVFLFLIVAAASLLHRTPSAFPGQTELRHAPDAPPGWNGSHPYLLTSLIGLESNKPTFKSSILLITPTVRHDSPISEFQVDLLSGRFLLRQTDLFISDIFPLSLTRTYTVWDPSARAFGIGANHPYDLCPTGSRNPYTYMDLNLEDGRQIHFSRISKGTGYVDAVFRHDETSSEFYGALIAWNGDGWTLEFPDGRRFLFPESYHATRYAQGAPLKMCDARGQCVQLERDERRNLRQVVSPSGHMISIKYDQADRVIVAESDSGDVRKYSYDSSGHLETVANASRLLCRFQYTLLLHTPGYDPYVMTAILDRHGNVLLKNSYRDGRVSEQKLSDGDVYRYEYTFLRGEIIQTKVNGPDGIRNFLFQHGRFLRAE